MFSLQRLLGKEDLFFGLLEASAIEAQNSVHALVKLSQSLDQPVELEAFAAARRKVIGDLASNRVKGLTKHVETAST